MIEYPSTFPCPLRAPYAKDLDFQTTESPMQSGYVIQRRREPYIFRRLSLSYQMSLEEYFAWWDWTQRYGFSWHTTEIQGTAVTLRHIDNVSFRYVDFATVVASVIAETVVAATPEFWDESANGAPALYEPAINAADPGDNTGGAVLDIDFKTAFEPLDETLAGTSQDYVFGTAQSLSAISTLQLIADAPLTIEVYDHPATTLITITADKVLRWHHDLPGQNAMLRLAPGTAYTLRVIGASGTSFRLWGYTR